MVQMMLSTGNDGNTTIITNRAKMEKISNNSTKKKKPENTHDKDIKNGIQ